MLTKGALRFPKLLKLILDIFLVILLSVLKKNWSGEVITLLSSILLPKQPSISSIQFSLFSKYLFFIKEYFLFPIIFL